MQGLACTLTPNPPDPQWPGGAKLALNFVLNYEEGSEYSILEGDPAAETYIGEVPVAYVVPAAGCSLGPAELEAAIVDACRGRIASFKIPRRVFVVDALPMTASGKVQKHLLRADVLDRLGAPTTPAPAP